MFAYFVNLPIGVLAGLTIASVWLCTAYLWHNWYRSVKKKTHVCAYCLGTGTMYHETEDGYTAMRCTYC